MEDLKSVSSLADFEEAPNFSFVKCEPFENTESHALKGNETDPNYSKIKTEILEDCNPNCKSTISLGKAKNIFKCDTCSFQAKTKTSFIKHILIAHPTASIKCPHCDYKCKRNSEITMHLRRNHLVKHNASKNKFACNICDYTSPLKANCTRHMLTHKNIKEVPSYRCTLCHYQTKYKPHLNQHQRVVHTKDITMFQCKECLFETKCPDELEKHIHTAHSKVPDEFVTFRIQRNLY